MIAAVAPTRKRYADFHLTLMLTHACNLRCSYCYTGEKVARAMSDEVAVTALRRATASLTDGGTLSVGFFGGEPLLKAGLILRVMEEAERTSRQRQFTLRFSMTTNGTIATPEAWRAMSNPLLTPAISCDGLPAIHDRHRRTSDGTGSYGTVIATIRQLVDRAIPFHALMVVRPDTVQSLPEGMDLLLRIGVADVVPSIDLWARWTDDDIRNLQSTVGACAAIWKREFPRFRIGWFEEKMAMMSGCLSPSCATCRFGDGELAVAPSGNFYPCERLISDDRPVNPFRMAGNVLDGGEDLVFSSAAPRSCAECSQCRISALCGTDCRCSNYVRTGDIAKPDRLLCVLQQICSRETRRVLEELANERKEVNHGTPRRISAA